MIRLRKCCDGFFVEYNGHESSNDYNTLSALVQDIQRLGLNVFKVKCNCEWLSSYSIVLFVEYNTLEELVNDLLTNRVEELL